MEFKQKQKIPIFFSYNSYWCKKYLAEYKNIDNLVKTEMLEQRFFFPEPLFYIIITRTIWSSQSLFDSFVDAVKLWCCGCENCASLCLSQLI